MPGSVTIRCCITVEQSVGGMMHVTNMNVLTSGLLMRLLLDYNIINNAIVWMNRTVPFKIQKIFYCMKITIRTFEIRQDSTLHMLN